MQRNPSDYYQRSDLPELVTRQCKDYPKSAEHSVTVLAILRNTMQYDADLAFGSLLGITRDKHLIPHDSDIDINIYGSLHDTFYRGLIKMYMEKQGYTCVCEDTYQIVFEHPESVLIDICFFQEQEDGTYLCAHQVRDFVLSAEATRDAETFLTEVYGDWKTPKGKKEDYLA